LVYVSEPEDSKKLPGIPPSLRKLHALYSKLQTYSQFALCFQFYTNIFTVCLVFSVLLKFLCWNKTEILVSFHVMKWPFTALWFYYRIPQSLLALNCMGWTGKSGFGFRNTNRMKDKIKQWWELSFDSFTGNGIYPKTYTHPITCYLIFINDVYSRK
jgi:hypothetical protein